VVLAGILMIVLLGVLVVSPEPASASRSCKSVKARSHRFSVTIEHGSVSCGTARKVIRLFLSGKGHKHGGPSQAETYWTVRGWRCGTGTGGGGCIRGGTSYLNARHYIIAQQI
jgi:hypothetical protein